MTPEMNTCMIWIYIYIYINICWYIMPCWVVNLNIIIWNLWFLWCYSFCWPDILNNQRLVKKNNTKKNMFQRLLHGFRGSFSHWAHNNGVPTGEPHSAPRIWPNKINAPRVFVKGPHCFMHDKHLNDSKKNHLDVTTSGFFNFEIIFSTFNSKKNNTCICDPLCCSYCSLHQCYQQDFSCPDRCILYFDWFFLELCLTFSRQEFLITSNQLNPRCTDRWQLANCNWLRRPLQDPTMIPRSIDLSFS